MEFDPSGPASLTGAASLTGGASLSDQEVALLTDAYIETLLASGTGAAPLDTVAVPLVDPDTVRAVDALAVGLVRFHPSFRFEERLAARLRDAARGRVAAGTSWVPGQPPVSLGTRATGALPDIGREVGRAVGRVERVPVSVLVGGAIASGVSLAGAAIVAWRLSRRPYVPRLP